MTPRSRAAAASATAASAGATGAPREASTKAYHRGRVAATCHNTSGTGWSCSPSCNQLPRLAVLAIGVTALPLPLFSFQFVCLTFS